MSKFYTMEDANKLRFYQVPKVLVEGEKYSDLGLAEKLTYGVLLDRLQLSIKNNWCDDNGFIYFLFSGEKLGELLNVHEKTARKYIRNLIKSGLAEEKRMGQGLTNKLYLIQPQFIESDVRKNIINEIEELTSNDVEKYEKEQKVPSEKINGNVEKYEKEQKVPSRRNEKSVLEGTKCSTNDTDLKETDFIDNLSITKNEIERLKEEKTKDDLIVDMILNTNDMNINSYSNEKQKLIKATLKEMISIGINKQGKKLSSKEVKLQLSQNLNEHNLWYSMEQLSQIKATGEPIKYEKRLLGTYIINNLYLEEDAYTKHYDLIKAGENIF